MEEAVVPVAPEPSPASTEEEVAVEGEPVPEVEGGGVVVGDSVEIIEQTVNHPLLTTSFQDYTVTEGLLLLLLLCFFVKACMTMVRRAFSWLLS